VGPTFKGIFNAERKISSNGKVSTVVADEAYLLKSIVDPNADLVEGYSSNLMQSYKDVLSKEEIQLIVDYLKELK
jgi:cytochrome c oxidase subunit 2